MRSTLISATALGLILSLSACGGGGGGGVNSPGTTPAPAPTPTPAPAPTPAPTPTPTPAPTPTPTPTSEEYNRSAAAVGAKAQYAYDNGITGKGVTIAIIDSGIDVDGVEFAGRISADSKSFGASFARCLECAPETVTFDLQDVQGHGTWVSSVAAGAKNDFASQGIAYDADILALKVGAPVLENLAPGETPKESGVNLAAVAPAIQYAMDHNAFVVNLSMNGTASGQIATDLRSAMDLVRARNGLLVQSVSNFPGDSYAGTVSEILVGSDFANKDWFLYGIRVDSALNPIAENGSPGALADRTLAVVADNLLVVGADGQTTNVGGNSFAAPTIAGAAALLKQYWPQLGGKEISSILLDTATDLGDAGVDQQYGKGLLNIEAAMKAQAPTLGTTTSNGQAVLSSSVVFSGAYGGSDASAKFSSVAGNAVALDRYGRDYQVNVGALASAYAPSGIQIGSLAEPVQPEWAPTPLNQVSSLALTGQNTTAHPVINNRSGRFGFRMSPTTAVAGQVNGSVERSGLMTGAMLRSLGLATRGSDVTFYNKGFSYGFATASNANDYRRVGSSKVSTFSLATPEGFTMALTSAKETGTALGMRGTGAFDIQGAKSTFATLGWNGQFGGFNLLGEVMAGRTKVQSRSAMLEFADAVLSSGFRFQADHAAFGGIATLGLTSPLKVERATLRYTAPVAFDVEAMELVNKTTQFGIAPDAREMNIELGWAKSFGASHVSFGGAYGMNAGNQRGNTSAAAWMRFGTKF